MIKELTMEKTSLPAGWEMKKLGEVCSFQGGSQPPKSQFMFVSYKLGISKVIKTLHTFQNLQRIDIVVMMISYWEDMELP